MFNKFFKVSVIMLLVFLLSCGSQQMVESKKDVDKLVKSQQELITDNIQDKQKQTELLEMVNAMNLDGMKFAKYYTEQRKIVTEMIKDQEISRQDFDSEVAEINDHYETYLKTLLQKQKAMRALVTADEWTKIMDWDNTYVPK